MTTDEPPCGRFASGTNEIQAGMPSIRHHPTSSGFCAQQHRAHARLSRSSGSGWRRLRRLAARRFRTRHTSRGKMLARERFDLLTITARISGAVRRSRETASMGGRTCIPQASLPGLGRILRRANACRSANDSTNQGWRHLLPIPYETLKNHLRSQDNNRPQNNSALRLHGRFRLRPSCRSRTRFSRTIGLSAHLLQSGTMSGAGHPQIAIGWAPARRGDANVPAMSDESSSCATRATHLSRRNRRW